MNPVAQLVLTVVQLGRAALHEVVRLFAQDVRDALASDDPQTQHIRDLVRTFNPSTPLLPAPKGHAEDGKPGDEGEPEDQAEQAADKQLAKKRGRPTKEEVARREAAATAAAQALAQAQQNGGQSQ